MLSSLALLWSAGAAAAEPSSAAGIVFPNVSISGLAGLGTPLGLVGVEATVDPFRWLSLSGGVGMAGPSGLRPQEAGMVRLRWPLPLARWTALTAGFGLSRGRYSSAPCVFQLWCSEKAGDLWWQNLEAGLEFRVRHDRPLIVRGFGGWSAVGNPDSLKCVKNCTLDVKGSADLPYVGLALGYAIR
jgi:hypothetical protein